MIHFSWLRDAGKALHATPRHAGTSATHGEHRRAAAGPEGGAEGAACVTSGFPSHADYEDETPPPLPPSPSQDKVTDTPL